MESDAAAVYDVTMPPKRVALKVTAVVVALVLACIVVGWFLWSKAMDRRLERTLDELAAAGFVLNLSAMAPPEIEPEQNAATIYTRAFTLLKDPPSRADNDLFWDWDQYNAPSVGLAELRAALTDEHRSELKTWFEQNEPLAQALLQAAAATRPGRWTRPLPLPIRSATSPCSSPCSLAS